MHTGRSNVLSNGKRKRHNNHQELGNKLQSRLHHDVKQVKKVAKKAKTFEIQKLIKKLKDLRAGAGTSTAMPEVEQELELLKALNHENMATMAVRTRINKIRILRDDQRVQAVMVEELISESALATPNTLCAKVQSRFLSSKMLASEITILVEDLKRIIQADDEIVGEVVTDDELHAKRVRKLEDVAVLEPTIQNSRGTREVGGGAEATDDESDGAGWESGTVNSGDSVAERESGGVGNGGESAGQSDDDHDPQQSSKSKQPSKALPTKTSEKPTGLRSTFLPSLSVGFTRGGSDDSDLSESEVKIADSSIKKNRRGQRARRAIWEKKYGKHANHKIKEQDRGYEHKITEGRTARQGTAQRSENHLNTVSSRKTDLHRPPPTLPAPWVRSLKEGKDKEALHPSWEAKRKLKEKERAIIVPSQGHKIKFS